MYLTMHPNQKPQKNLKNYVRAVLYFFALEIHITFGPVKENFRLGLVFEINSPPKKVSIFIFWTKYQYITLYLAPHNTSIVGIL